MQKEEYLKKLGDNLRKLREERNLTQSALASLLDKDRQSYQRVESGGINPTIWYLNEIAKALNVPVKDILDFE